MSNNINRRNFINKLALGVGAVTLSPALVRNTLAQDTSQKTKRKYGIALVGLGYYSTDLLAPALQITRNVKLTGIVTGTPAKAKKWSVKYNIPEKNIYNYETYDDIADNPDIDIIYVVLPNDMHKEYTIRAAKAGKHVICEKPMALNVQECKEMIQACKDNNVELSIGYRLHFDPVTKQVMSFRKEDAFGKAKFVTANAGWPNNQPKTTWRLQKKHGGGVLMDMGVYTIQAARYTVGEEPSYVTAQQYKTDPVHFDEVDQIVSVQLEFPGGAVASLLTTFDSYVNLHYASYQKGWVELNPYWSYTGLKGFSSMGPVAESKINQQAAHMDSVAWSIDNKQPMVVGGDEGLKDMVVVMGVYEALSAGKKVKLG